ncbi:MAG: type II toxin-antitoxin system VapC family toxin [Thiolinea sp.]
MFVLDTNVLSELMKSQSDANVIAWLDQQLDSELFYCVVSKTEIEWGIAKLPDGKRKQQLSASANNIFALFDDRCLTYDCVAASVYVEIAQLAKLAGRPMSTEDMIIAAIALANGASLATRNVADFEVLQVLNLINPWSV